ncbi:hypothetical protein Pla22_40760 [Rubripirellula amarantea]|uniref:Uncharacterized protein n=1 Tax=Rubripirellula amarantea TaxID=2527999 RepID=A0A5C5WMI1_9BACT|nr:hypothetical protein Pla22_40760 [Rubripirellula amarantea]
MKHSIDRRLPRGKTYEADEVNLVFSFHRGSSAQRRLSFAGYSDLAVARVPFALRSNKRKRWN